MRDIENSVNCSVDEMLKDLLLDCTDQPRESFDDASKARLFERCLDAILPICNGEAKPIKKFNVKSSQLKASLAN